MEAILPNTEISEIEVKNIISSLLQYIGENTEREGLRETPERVLKSFKELFGGYKVNTADIFKTFTEGNCQEMVVLKNIEFVSFCEHHILPFYGEISIGYIPNGKVIGVSKLARLVEIFSKRLQIQENLTKQIADEINNKLEPLGVMVVCKAKHLCMIARGIKKQNAVMVTSAIRGRFNDNNVREEFLKLLEI
ncbi:GTP cyclohydrolase I FolE [Patescibacteria group bacterium]|nr:GTP cyclohydrolase I FolE [Patescibacteria group bacterium]